MLLNTAVRSCWLIDWDLLSYMNLNEQDTKIAAFLSSTKPVNNLRALESLSNASDFLSWHLKFIGLILKLLLDKASDILEIKKKKLIVIDDPDYILIIICSFIILLPISSYQCLVIKVFLMFTMRGLGDYSHINVWIIERLCCSTCLIKLLFKSQEHI